MEFRSADSPKARFHRVKEYGMRIVEFQVTNKKRHLVLPRQDAHDKLVNTD